MKNFRLIGWVKHGVPRLVSEWERSASEMGRARSKLDGSNREYLSIV